MKKFYETASIKVINLVMQSIIAQSGVDSETASGIPDLTTEEW